MSSALAGGADTIVAPATARGGAALAVIRISGPEAGRIGRVVCPLLDSDRPWRARLVEILSRQGEVIDRGVAIAYAAPKSYTGEDMVELMIHGSPWVVSAVVDAACGAGARMAEPGEFTRRAVANGKMDLVQAEAVNDLVRAETAWQARLAREQMHGELGSRITPLRDDLVALLAKLEGSLDFEDQGVVVDDVVLRRHYESCRERIENLLATVRAGSHVREGVRVAVVGPPNVGKSTLFNALLDRERAIVADMPGTTRDVLEAALEIEGLPVVLVDTAGLRTPEDPVEVEGVGRARRETERAAIVLELASAERGEPTWPVAASVGERVIRVQSKIDLGGRSTAGTLAISCRTGEGLAALRRELHRRVAQPLEALPEAVALNARHAEALRRAGRCLERALSAPREVAAAEVRSATTDLGEILGSVADEDVLDAVFASFCVGK